MDDRSSRLLARWRDGDEQAAEQIFERYVQQLIGLARNRLSSKMRRRIDPEDVVQSAYRSFFHHARDNRYSLERSGDLWRLLAAITVNKLHNKVEFHQAQKRAMSAERTASAGDSTLGLVPEAIARDPSPSEAAIVVEELEAVMRGLEPVHRKILELRLTGTTIEEVAMETQRSERTVRRVLERIRGELEGRLSGNRSG